MIMNNEPLPGPESIRRTSNRIIIKKGSERHILRSEEVMYLYIFQKLVFAVDKDNIKHICEASNLADLTATLDRVSFLRVNRKYVVNVNFITWFRSIDHGRMKIGLQQMPPEDIIVSQANAPEFRKWIRTA